jgi:hypothetical protein
MHKILGVILRTLVLSVAVTTQPIHVQAAPCFPFVVTASHQTDSSVLITAKRTDCALTNGAAPAIIVGNKSTQRGQIPRPWKLPGTKNIGKLEAGEYYVFVVDLTSKSPLSDSVDLTIPR